MEAFKEWTLEREMESEIAARTKRIRGNTALYQEFAKVDEAESWLQQFTADAVRYPVLLVHGPSRCGKTEWAKSLFKNPLVLQIGLLSLFAGSYARF